MKVLVTGVAGFIGSHVALSLLSRGDDVVGIDNSKVARAAMRLGIQQILALAARDVDKAVDLVLINDARAK